MPLYEYHCNQCGYRYEKIQKFNSEAEVACPKCGGELQRPLTAPALQFKGAGWYVNDYSPKGGSSTHEKAAGETPAGGGSKPSTASRPASESKPAATESTAKPSAPSATKSAD